MTPFSMDRTTRTKLFVDVLKCLRGAPGVSEEQAEAYAATVALAEFPDEIFALARALDGYLYPFMSGGEFINLDISELHAEHDDMTIRAALTLAGWRERESTPGTWTNAPIGRGGENAQTLRLPPDLLKDFYS